MKNRYYIRDFVQKDEDNRPFYYMGFTTNGSWTTCLPSAREYETKQEALWKLAEIIKEENGSYEIVETYN